MTKNLWPTKKAFAAVGVLLMTAPPVTATVLAGVNQEKTKRVSARQHIKRFSGASQPAKPAKVPYNAGTPNATIEVDANGDGKMGVGDSIYVDNDGKGELWLYPNGMVEIHSHDTNVTMVANNGTVTIKDNDGNIKRQFRYKNGRWEELKGGKWTPVPEPEEEGAEEQVEPDDVTEENKEDRE